MEDEDIILSLKEKKAKITGELAALDEKRASLRAELTTVEKRLKVFSTQQRKPTTEELATLFVAELARDPHATDDDLRTCVVNRLKATGHLSFTGWSKSFKTALLKARGSP
jgi:proline racemase